jgi:hypothetical protein
MKNLSRSQNLHEVFLNSFEQRWGGALKSPWGQLKIDAVYDPESQRWALASLIFFAQCAWYRIK